MIYSRLPKKVIKAIALFLIGVICSNIFIYLPTPPTRAQNPEACAQIVNPLNPAEEKLARGAWQYFVNNYQPNTGFANSANGYPSGTLWDMGNYLMALNAARWLNFIDQGEFDSRLNKFLSTMSQLRLFEDSLPNKVYQAATGELVDYGNNPLERGIGWSALDIGRIFAAFHVLRTCHPQYSEWLQSVLDRWAIERSIIDQEMFGATVLDDGQTLLVQEGRMGYEEYASRGYELWGYQVPVSLSFEPFKFVEIYGVQIPVDTREYQETNANNYVVSESYILDGIEFGFKGEIAEYAARVLEVQKRRYENTGQLTAVSEDNIDRPPYFLYNTVFANGNAWATITEKNELHPELRTVSCKAALGWNFLYPNNQYAQLLYNSFLERCQSPDGGGVYAGFYEETDQANGILTGNTNGIVMEMIYYKALGNRPLIGHDLVAASTGKPIGPDHTAPIFTAGGQPAPPAPPPQPTATTTAPPAPPPQPAATTTAPPALPPQPAAITTTTCPPPPPQPTATTTCPPPVALATPTLEPAQVLIPAIAKVGKPRPSECPALSRSLNVPEKRHAEAAWQYFEYAYQENTGVVNDRPDLNGFSLWGVGDYLAALHAARSLEVISADKFDRRVRHLLGALQRVPLFAGQIPHRSYDSQTLEPVDYGGNPSPEGTGWSGLDIARVMGALYNLKNCHLEYTQVVDEILLQWSYIQVVRNSMILRATMTKDKNGRTITTIKPERRLGYEEYAARALQLWGFDVERAAVSDRYQTISLEDVAIPVHRYDDNPQDYLVSNPFLRYGLEFGFDPQMKRLVESILEVQKKRYRSTGILTAAGTILINRPPYIIQSTITGWGKAWANRAADGQFLPKERLVSTAAAFAFYALFPEDDYARLLWEATVDLYNSILGYYEGFYEKNGEREPSLSLSTNSIVLQAILYRVLEREPLIRPEIAMDSPWWQAVTKGDFGKGLPEKPQQTARLIGNSSSSYWTSLGVQSDATTDRG